MKIELRFRDLEVTEELKDHAERQVHFHLSRFGGELTHVVIRVRDVNGPREGIDKHCQVTARGPRLGSTRIEAQSADASSAIDLAMERMARTVGREFDRLRAGARAAPAVLPQT